MGVFACVCVLGVGDHHASEKYADLSKNPPHCFADGRLTCTEDETVIVGLSRVYLMSHVRAQINSDY